MHGRQFEQLARQRTGELSTPRVTASPPRSGAIRSTTGWAIVAIGLRIAESGTR